MAMKAPPHPGRLILSACLKPLGLGVDEAARVLEVSRTELAAVIEEHAPLTSELALRLEKAFGGTADSWVRLQAAYDLAKARSRIGPLRLRRFQG